MIYNNINCSKCYAVREAWKLILNNNECITKISVEYIVGGEIYCLEFLCYRAVAGPASNSDSLDLINAWDMLAVLPNNHGREKLTST